MRLIFYIFLISQFFNFLELFAEKEKEELPRLNSVKWEKVEENKSKPLKKIIWKSYKNDEFYFGNEEHQKSSKIRRSPWSDNGTKARYVFVTR